MKKNKIVKVAYFISSLISNIMCASVAYKYCEIQYMIKYKGFSAPASIVFLWTIPYIICIAICLIFAKIENKKYSNNLQK